MFEFTWETIMPYVQTFLEPWQAVFTALVAIIIVGGVVSLVIRWMRG